MNEAIGMIETVGYVGLIEASDAMCKAANVKRLAIFHHDPDHEDPFMERLEARDLTELRFPLVDRMQFPFGSIRNLRGVLFLDVGTAYGYFPKAARSQGWDAVGVEIAADLISDLEQACRERGLLNSDVPLTPTAPPCGDHRTNAHGRLHAD